IIAVSYEARAEGVKRGMWGKTAISVCPNLILFEVPEKRGKADLAKYRSASAEVFQCISEHFKDVERASIDEAYVDLTELVTSTVQQIDWTKSGAHQPNSESFVVIDSGSALEASANGMCAVLDRLDWVNYLEERFNDGLRYAVATELTHKLRQTILTRTGFRCSAGIAPNKWLDIWISILHEYVRKDVYLTFKVTNTNSVRFQLRTSSDAEAVVAGFARLVIVFSYRAEVSPLDRISVGGRLRALRLAMSVKKSRESHLCLYTLLEVIQLPVGRNSPQDKNFPHTFIIETSLQLTSCGNRHRSRLHLKCTANTELNRKLLSISIGH
ncbi:DNA polymerase eta subunit, partial [Clonorchis sinensis]